MTVRRLPILILLVALAIGAFAAPGPVDGQAAVETVIRAPDAGVVPADDALSSTWFCAGGAGARGDVTHEIIVSNLSDARRSGLLTILTEDPDQRAEEAISIGPSERQIFPLGSYVDSESAGAIVELDGGLVAVEQRAAGVLGHDHAACSTSPSQTWYFAWGRTSLQSRLRLALLNPFSDDAVVDVSFDTDDGFRSPAAYEGLTIRAGTVRVIEVGDEVQRRDRLAAQIVARSGRLVADRLQVFSDVDGVTGLDLTQGTAEPATTWVFADGRLDESWSQRILLFNPNTDPAQVSLSVIPDAAGAESDSATSIEPFELVVLPQRQIELVLSDEGRLPTSLAHATFVESLNEVPIVAERVVWSPASADDAVLGDGADLGIGSGLSVESGWSRAATSIEVPSPIDDLADTHRLVVLNPSTTAVSTVTVSVRRDGRLTEVAGFDLGSLERLELDPAEWIADDAETGTSGQAATVVVDASEPVVVDRSSSNSSGWGLSTSRGIAVDGTSVEIGDR